MEEFKQPAGELMKTVTSGATTLGTAVFSIVKEASDSTRGLSTEAKKLDVSTDVLQQAMYASKKTGESLEDTLKLYKSNDAKTLTLMNQAGSMGAVVDAKTLEQLDIFNQQLTQSAGFLQSFKNTIVAGLAPAVNSLLHLFNNWVLSNEEIISSQVAAWAERISQVLLTLGDHFMKLDGFVELIGGWEVAFNALAIAVGALSFLHIAGQVHALIAPLWALFAVISKIGIASIIAFAKPLIILALIFGAVYILKKALVGLFNIFKSVLSAGAKFFGKDADNDDDVPRRRIRPSAKSRDTASASDVSGQDTSHNFLNQQRQAFAPGGATNPRSPSNSNVTQNAEVNISIDQLPPNLDPREVGRLVGAHTRDGLDHTFRQTAASNAGGEL